MDFALLQVGITSYSGGLALRGCVNDCKNLLNQFSRFKGAPTEWLQLIDGDATRTRILDGLQWLISADSPLLIFQYSGHGARVRDRNGDESDKYDSAICPVDFCEEGLILDDELADIYAHTDSSKRLIIFFDSCHSGQSQRGITRQVKAMFRMSIPRFLPESAIDDKTAEKSRPLAGYKLTTRKSFIENNERAILISSSKETQTSADAYIDKMWQGAGTAALLYAWNQLGINANYWDAARVANVWLKKNDYSQVLRVEGGNENKGRPIFT